jgi:hypothetical protein
MNAPPALFDLAVRTLRSITLRTGALIDQPGATIQTCITAAAGDCTLDI